MKYADFVKLFNFEMPAYAADHYESFVKTYDRKREVLCAAGAELIAEKTALPADGRAALEECAAVLNSDDNGHLCASFLVYLTVCTRAPWLNFIYTDDLFDVPGLKKEQVNDETLVMLRANSDLKERGSFECSDPVMNALRDMSRVSDLANFYYFPTDCPHREKNGWTG
ncbi:MAG: hypothetical protein J6252_03990, partial [Clostridia bacterium]|nr:hypothetical protein [Clostridia bacterium]